jgi:hypothetical protein
MGKPVFIESLSLGDSLFLNLDDEYINEGTDVQSKYVMNPH